MSAIISLLDNRSTSQGGVIFPQLELLTRFLSFLLCLHLEFVGNPLFYDAFRYFWCIVQTMAIAEIPNLSGWHSFSKLDVNLDTRIFVNLETRIFVNLDTRIFVNLDTRIFVNRDTGIFVNGCCLLQHMFYTKQRLSRVSSSVIIDLYKHEVPVTEWFWTHLFSFKSEERSNQDKR